MLPVAQSSSLGRSLAAGHTAAGIDRGARHVWRHRDARADLRTGGKDMAAGTARHVTAEPERGAARLNFVQVKRQTLENGSSSIAAGRQSEESRAAARCALAVELARVFSAAAQLLEMLA